MGLSVKMFILFSPFTTANRGVWAPVERCLGLGPAENQCYHVQADYGAVVDK